VNRVPTKDEFVPNDDGWKCDAFELDDGKNPAKTQV